MRHLTRLTRLAALPLAATLLVACGGGDGGDGGESSGGEETSSAESSGDYCGQLEEAKTTFEDFGGQDTDAAQVEEFFSTLHGLAEASPEEVEPQWTQVDGAVTGLEDALQEAGLELEDFSNLQAGQLPEGVTQEDIAPVLTAAQEFASEENSQAFEEINTHAEEECGVDLDGSDSASPSEGASESPSESPSDEAGN